MTELEIFIQADTALAHVVGQIKPDQWTMPIPDWFAVGPTEQGLPLRGVINRHAYDEAWVPDVLAGKTAAEVGAKYDGDLLGDDPRASFASITEAALAAARALTEADLAKTVHLSYGDFSARDYLKHITIYRAPRAYDIAKLIGVDTTLPPQLVQGLYDQLAPEIDQWRAMGVFGPALEAPNNADAQTKLFALIGRSA